MAYDDGLAQRIREALQGRAGITEKRMFGGIAFLLHGRMVVGVAGTSMMARVGPDRHAEALTGAHVRPMDFTGRPMKGYVFVEAAGLESDRALAAWIEVCLAFVASLPADDTGRKAPAKARRRATSR